jgi:hypothetical protein
MIAKGALIRLKTVCAGNKYTGITHDLKFLGRKAKDKMQHIRYVIIR